MWDVGGVKNTEVILMTDYFPMNQTINTEYYSNLCDLRAELKEKNNKTARKTAERCSHFAGNALAHKAHKNWMF